MTFFNQFENPYFGTHEMWWHCVREIKPRRFQKQDMVRVVEEKDFVEGRELKNLCNFMTRMDNNLDVCVL